MKRYKEATGNIRVSEDLLRAFNLPALTVFARHLGPLERRKTPRRAQRCHRQTPTHLRLCPWRQQSTTSTEAHH